MVQNSANSVKGYLAELEPEKRRIMSKVLNFIRDNLPTVTNLIVAGSVDVFISLNDQRH